ncbi:MAG: RNA polymerase sigma-54 factor, partial [Clostridia bacterium]|nr:RNA polymerase sigma-54 factor [Clostridia bacterium]
FFSRSYSGEDGRNYSGAYVRSLIASLVASEDKSSPLSDRQIEEALRARGVPVARRTVAKYRDEMGLPKKSFRRR